MQTIRWEFQAQIFKLVSGWWSTDHLLVSFFFSQFFFFLAGKGRFLIWLPQSRFTCCCHCDANCGNIIFLIYISRVFIIVFLSSFSPIVASSIEIENNWMGEEFGNGRDKKQQHQFRHFPIFSFFLLIYLLLLITFFWEKKRNYFTHKIREKNFPKLIRKDFSQTLFSLLQMSFAGKSSSTYFLNNFHVYFAKNNIIIKIHRVILINLFQLRWKREKNWKHWKNWTLNHRYNKVND